MSAGCKRSPSLSKRVGRLKITRVNHELGGTLLSHDTKAQPTKVENMIELWFSRLCAPVERCKDAIKPHADLRALITGASPNRQ